ncbi:MAG: diacylglycerol/lipid kinase family protein [Casimicrobiaceae bacterium]
MNRSGEIVVIINPGSGTAGAKDLVTRLEDVFRRAGVNAAIVSIPPGERIESVVRSALDRKPVAIVAGGGDGTVNAVASALVGTETALGVLPLGTLNHFAKAIGIPATVEDAADVVVAGRTRQVDVGEVNGRIFLNNSSLGLYPQMVKSRQQHQKLGWGKWPSFAWALVTVLRRHPFLQLQLDADGKKVNRRTPLVFIGNNKYQLEGLRLGERERLDGGELGLCITRGQGRRGLLRLAMDALLHRLRKGQDLDAIMLKECRVDSHQKRLEVAIDGEVAWMDLPLHYRVRPLALKVLA